MTTLDIAGAIARATRGVLDNEGATVSVVAKPDPTSGYVVANGRDETTSDLDGTPDTIARETVARLIGAYVESHRSALAQTGAYLGAWVDDGYLVLDVVNVLPERNVALNLARERGERAIFDLSAGETLWTHKFFTVAGPYARPLLDSSDTTPTY